MSPAISAGAFALLTALVALGAPACASGTDAGKLNVLFLTGGCCHDWDALPPILVEILEATGDFTVTVSQDRDLLKPESVRQFDLLLFYTQGGDISDDQRDGLLGFVRDGGAFVGIHSATATFKTSDDYWKLVGGRFTRHDYRDFTVRCIDTRHPITRVFDSFDVKDEDFNHVFHPEADLDVLAVRDGDIPVMWTRAYGKGRVFINALGHNEGVWTNRYFQMLTVRGMYWAANREPKPLPAKSAR